MSIESQPAVPDAPLSEQKRRLLEKYLRGDVPPTPGAHDLIPRRPAGMAAPLSAGQHQIWLHSQMAPGLPLYNEPLTVHRIGPLDVAALEWSLCEILRRHEAWRTTVAVVGGEPVQVVQAVPRVALPVVDLRSLPEIEREPEALRLATEDARRPIDLVRGPLARFRLIRLRDEEHRLYITLHQMIFDGVSMYSVFLPELTALYEARVGGRPSPLREPSVQYGDFALWQVRRLREAASSSALDYWRRQLEGAPALLPRRCPDRGGGEEPAARSRFQPQPVVPGHVHPRAAPAPPASGLEPDPDGRGHGDIPVRPVLGGRRSSAGDHRPRPLQHRSLRTRDDRSPAAAIRGPARGHRRRSGAAGRRPAGSHAARAQRSALPWRRGGASPPCRLVHPGSDRAVHRAALRPAGRRAPASYRRQGGGKGVDVRGARRSGRSSRRGDGADRR